MGRKIRFSLDLADGTQARTLDELREHFDMESVLDHYRSGKLLVWLEDRYLEGEAEAIRTLDEADGRLRRQLCEIFQVEYTSDDERIKAAQLRQERLAKLRTITEAQEFIDHIDQVAFNQEELADLLDERETTIYLCGGKFIIPASQRGVTYVGIGKPKVHISGKMPEALPELGIFFEGCDIDNFPNPNTSFGESLQETYAVLCQEEYEALLIHEIIRINDPDDIQHGGLNSLQHPKRTEDGSLWDLIDQTRMVWTFQNCAHRNITIDISIMDIQWMLDESSDF